MLRVLGLLIVAVGGMYPLVVTYRMNKQLARPDGPTGKQLTLWLGHMLTFPMALALSGAALIIPQLWRSGVFQGVVVAFWLVALLMGGAYVGSRRIARYR